MRKIAFWIFMVVCTVLLASCAGEQTEAPTATAVVASPTEAAEQTEEAAPAETLAPEPTEATPEEPATVSFAQDVQPIFESYCVRCHGPSRASSGLTLDSYAAIMAGARSGPVVEAGNAAGSLLIDVVSSGRMPPSGAGPSADEIQRIADWINAGALEN